MQKKKHLNSVHISINFSISLVVYYYYNLVTSYDGKGEHTVMGSLIKILSLMSIPLIFFVHCNNCSTWLHRPLCSSHFS